MDACFYYVCNILTQPSKCHSRNGDSLSVIANCRLHFLFLAALNDAPCSPSAVARLPQGGFNMLRIQSGPLTINNTLLFSLYFWTIPCNSRLCVKIPLDAFKLRFLKYSSSLSDTHSVNRAKFRV